MNESEVEMILDAALLDLGNVVMQANNAITRIKAAKVVSSPLAPPSHFRSFWQSHPTFANVVLSDYRNRTGRTWGCYIACFADVAFAFGDEIATPLEMYKRLRSKNAINEKGNTAARYLPEISEVVRYDGDEVVGWPSNALLAQIPSQRMRECIQNGGLLIAHVDMTKGDNTFVHHYVVIYEINGDEMIMADPLRGDFGKNLLDRYARGVQDVSFFFPNRPFAGGG